MGHTNRSNILHNLASLPEHTPEATTCDTLSAVQTDVCYIKYIQDGCKFTTQTDTSNIITH